MKLLPSQILSEKFEYRSDLSVNDFGFVLQWLFMEDIRYKGVNLKGTFVLQNTFEITPKHQPIHIRNFEREVSYVKGSFRSDYGNGTIVSFSVRPNSIFMIFFLVCIFIGSVSTILVIKNGFSRESIPFLLFFLLIFPLAICLFAKSAKKAIKNEFISVLNLKEMANW